MYRVRLRALQTLYKISLELTENGGITAAREVSQRFKNLQVQIVPIVATAEYCGDYCLAWIFQQSVSGLVLKYGGPSLIFSSSGAAESRHRKRFVASFMWATVPQIVS